MGCLKIRLFACWVASRVSCGYRLVVCCFIGKSLVFQGFLAARYIILFYYFFLYIYLVICAVFFYTSPLYITTYNILYCVAMPLVFRSSLTFLFSFTRLIPLLWEALLHRLIFKKMPRPFLSTPKIGFQRFLVLPLSLCASFSLFGRFFSSIQASWRP